MSENMNQPAGYRLLDKDEEGYGEDAVGFRIYSNSNSTTTLGECMMLRFLYCENPYPWGKSMSDRPTYYNMCNKMDMMLKAKELF